MAPKLPELLPVVIPPISSPPFTCEGEGLVCNGYKRDSIDDLKVWVSAKRVKNSPKHPKAWWQAQLHLYGLNAGFSSTTIAELKKRLKDELGKGLKGPSKEVLALEKKLNTEFIKKNAKVRNGKDSNELRLGAGSCIEVAEPESQESEEEGAIKGKRQKVGRSVNHGPASGSGKAKFEDVVGEWSVKVPEITENWSRFGDEFRMSIFFHKLVAHVVLDYWDYPFAGYSPAGEKMKRKEDELTKSEMLWANFHWGVISGVLHVKGDFPKSGPIPSKPIPFVWRGRESGEGQIQVDDYGNFNKGTITFISPTTLKGEVNGSVFQRCKFEGTKISTVPQTEIAEAWHNLSEKTWNVECVSRWH